MKLDGVRVLDLSRFLPGPYMGMLLADHGAEVIKIEHGSGEPTRYFGPEVEGFTTYFRNTQRGKLSVKLNLKEDEGVHIFLKLAEQTDIIIDSFRPGVVDRLGIGYEAVVKRNPGIIFCSLSAFGQTGEMSTRPSHDLGAQAITGVLSLGSRGADDTALPASPTADVALGSLALVGIMMALFRRETSGRGDYLDMSMTDSLMSWTPHILSEVIANNAAPNLGRERLYGGAAFYNIYETSDGRRLVLSGSEMNFVENLLNALKRPDLIPLCEKPWGEAQKPVKEFLRRTFLTRTLSEWSEWFSERSVCWAPVLELDEAWEQKFLRERGIISKGKDGIERVGTPVRFLNEPGAPSDKLPTVGEDTQQVLGQVGYGPSDYDRLIEEGVC